jgi:hypothetical protein
LGKQALAFMRAIGQDLTAFDFVAWFDEQIARSVDRELDAQQARAGGI